MLPLCHSSLITHHASLLAVSFLTPALAIAGAALVAVPILIHLLNRRRFKTVEWAAMRFVLAAIKKNRRRMRFESWLLLAMRCAAIALAGVALARPVGCAGSAMAGAVGREAGLHVILLDDSGSTLAEGADGTVYDALQNVAADLIEMAGRNGGRTAVLVASTPADDIVQAPTFDADAAAFAVSEREATEFGTDLAGAFERAAAVVGEAAAGERVTVHLLTDAAAASLDDPRLAEIAGQLETEGVDLQVHRPAGDGPTNAAVTDVRTSVPLVRRGFPAQLVADAAAFGGTADATLAWSVNERNLDSPALRIDGPDGEAIMASPSVLDAIADGRQHVVAAALRESDASGIEADDTRRLVVQQVAQLPVLLVEGPLARGGSSIDRPAVLATALSPGGESGYLSVEAVGDLELGGRSLDGYAAVVLAGVGGLDEATAAQLAEFVRGGGALMIFVGEATTAENYNSTLYEAGLLPGQLVKRVLNSGPEEDGGLMSFDFDPRNVHRYLDAFRNADRSGLDAPAIRQYWEVDLDDEPSDGAAAEVVLRFASTSDPAVTVQRVGNGVVTGVFSAAADADWSLLTSRRNYPAFLHELLSHTLGESGGGVGWQTIEVGERVDLPATVRIPPGATPRLMGGDQPEGRPLGRQVMEDGSVRWRSEPIALAGEYVLMVGEARYPIAANFPAGESDTRRADDATLRAALGGVEMEVFDLDASAMAAEASADDAPDWGWPLLLAVLLLAGGEAAFASHLGRHRA